MRVLVAEEDLITLTHLQRMLRSFGHEVEAVRDGLAAWKYLQKNESAGVAILDGILPGKDGLEIARASRSQGSSHYTYIILLARNNEKCEVAEALEAGADGLLSLPVSAAELTCPAQSGGENPETRRRTPSGNCRTAGAAAHPHVRVACVGSGRCA